MKRANYYTREEAIICQTLLHGDEVMWELQKHGFPIDGGVVSLMSAKEIGEILDLSVSSVTNIIAGLIEDGRLSRIKGKRASFFIADKFLT